MRLLVGILLCSSLFAALTPEEQAALNRISAASMRGHLSFLASDALEGRGTPSRGQDIAAEYIAAQFRRAGLEPAGPNGSYFQNAPMQQFTQQTDGFQLTWKSGGMELPIPLSDVWVSGMTGVDLKDMAVVPVAADNVEGKVLVADAKAYLRQAELLKLRARKPALILLFSNGPRMNLPATQLLEADAPGGAPIVVAFGAKSYRAMESVAGASVSMHLAAPVKKAVTLRNVAAVLRGSDPVLSKQYVIFSAHYDHIGMKDAGDGDRIFNGANDNGSGTVSVMEIGAALASMPVHPKRSILFLAFYGEELGLLGAYYYTKHPLVPLADTIININLEQMGRTDEQDGKQVNSFAFTGPTFSNAPKIMEDAAKLEDIKIYQKQGADAFFARSDNFAFAKAGIVDHTAVVAFEYPDYHGLGDEWEKIDYENMARVDKGVAAGLLAIANAAEAPKWNETPMTEAFRKVAK